VFRTGSKNREKTHANEPTLNRLVNSFAAALNSFSTDFEQFFNSFSTVFQQKLA